MLDGLNEAKVKRLLWDFGGQTYMGCEMAQYQVDLVLWERFLSSASDIRAIVELGTGRGGMSLFLALQAYQRGMEFWTFDWLERGCLDSPLAKLLDLREHFVLGDLFGETNAVVIDLLTQKLAHPLLLYCDDGKTKDREFKEFVPYLQAGDYVGVHDWPTAIEQSTIEQFSLQPMWWDQWEKVGSITRFLKVVGV